MSHGWHAEMSSPHEQEGGKTLASPAVRRIAREHGVDLASVTGTGPEGRITKGAHLCHPVQACHRVGHGD